MLVLYTYIYNIDFDAVAYEPVICHRDVFNFLFTWKQLVIIYRSLMENKVSIRLLNNLFIALRQGKLYK